MADTLTEEIEVHRLKAVEMAVRGTPLEQLQEQLQLDESDVEWLKKLKPSPFMFPDSDPPRSGVQDETKAKHIKNLQAAYRFNDSKAVTTSVYDVWAKSHTPRETLAGSIVSVFGSWSEACKAAEVPYVKASRKHEDYLVSWTDEMIDEILDKFAKWCIKYECTPTGLNYEFFRRSRSTPSLTIIRRRVPNFTNVITDKCRDELVRVLVGDYDTDAA